MPPLALRSFVYGLETLKPYTAVRYRYWSTELGTGISFRYRYWSTELGTGISFSEFYFLVTHRIKIWIQRPNFLELHYN
jgi:hypothetical protein